MTLSPARGLGWRVGLLRTPVRPLACCFPLQPTKILYSKQICMQVLQARIFKNKRNSELKRRCGTHHRMVCQKPGARIERLSAQQSLNPPPSLELIRAVGQAHTGCLVKGARSR